MKQTSQKFDLEERTAKFGEAVIGICRKVKKDPITSSLVNQLVRSATSIGANYMEANGASSKRDFRNKTQFEKGSSGNTTLVADAECSYASAQR